MQESHLIDLLFNKLKDISPYPDGVIPVPKRLEGAGFFPSSAGLWGIKPNDLLPPMPIGGVMILGHDWGTEAYYNQELANCSENLQSPTPRTLLWLLVQVNIPVHACFFTNVYMGLRAGSAKTRGAFLGHAVHTSSTSVRCFSRIRSQRNAHALFSRSACMCRRSSPL